MAQGDGVGLTSARYLAMKAVISSQEGLDAMAKAMANGHPPLCGVDHLLTKIIVDYAAKDDQILRSAGSLVAEHMFAQGFTKGPIKPCPSGCTVETGSTFTPPAAP